MKMFLGGDARLSRSLTQGLVILLEERVPRELGHTKKIVIPLCASRVAPFGSPGMGLSTPAKPTSRFSERCGRS